MFTGGEVDFSLGLTGTKMQVIEVIWNRLIQRRHLRIEQQMMVAGILPIGARRRHSHAAKPKMNGRLGRQRITVLKVDKINSGPRGGRCRSAASVGLTVCSSRGRNPD